MTNIELDYYELMLTGYNLEIDTMNPSKATITLTSTGIMGGEVPLEALARDASLMNAIRKSADPAVKEAFDQVLTIMALTNGRTIP